MGDNDSSVGDNSVDNSQEDPNEKNVEKQIKKGFLEKYLDKNKLHNLNPDDKNEYDKYQ